MARSMQIIKLFSVEPQAEFLKFLYLSFFSQIAKLKYLATSKK